MKKATLDYLLQHLETLIAWRITNPKASFKDAPKLDIARIAKSPFGKAVAKTEQPQQNAIILLLALLPQLDDTLLEALIQKHPSPLFKHFCEVNQIIYTSPIAISRLLGGADYKARAEALQLMSPQSHLIKQNHIQLWQYQQNIQPFHWLLTTTPEVFNRLVLNQELLPEKSSAFPAEQITTQREWTDLILPQTTLSQLQAIQDWDNAHSILMHDWQMSKTLKPGYRVLFYGESGTGKTLAASLLGKYTNRPVFRVDLSTVVSKYIGETEKHLANLFNKAEDKNWILFFDEADSIFGKRTNVRDAHDKYANQEVSYLLQRIEQFSGLVILASNFKNNIDKAFTRRFHSTIKFNKPNPESRLRLWQANLPKPLDMSTIDLKKLAQRYELTGANIMNVIQDLSLKIIARGETDKPVDAETLIASIKKEYEKEDRIF